LIKSRSDCGDGLDFYVRKGRYSKSDLDDLRKLIAYRFDGTRTPHISFEMFSEIQVTPEEITELLSRPTFERWAGKRVVNAIRKFMAARRQFYENIDKLPRPEKDAKQFFRHKVIVRYHATGQELLNSLKGRFGIVAKGPVIDCD
jgi:hypothetical protein